MPTQPDLPHVRAEWLPALLSGDYACEWAIWTKVHHPDRVPPQSSPHQDADPEHAALLDQQKVNWAERDYEVSTDNAFLLRGRHAVLAGAPQLIVSRDEHTSSSSASPPARRSVPTARSSASTCTPSAERRALTAAWCCPASWCTQIGQPRFQRAA